MTIVKLFLILILFIHVAGLNAQRFIRTAKNYAELQNLNPNDPTATNVFVNGYSAVNDGGQGIFSWIWASATASDGGTVLPPTTGNWSGRWKRQYDGALNPQWFGASSGGASSALLSISNALTASAGQTLHIPRGTFRINGSLYPWNNTTIEGEGATSVLFIDSQTYGFVMDGSTGVKFRNLKFQGPSVSAIYSGSGCTNLSFENCEFTGFTMLPTSFGTGPIYLQTATGVTIDNCYFHDNGFLLSHEQAYFNQTYDVIMGRGTNGFSSFLKLLNSKFVERYVNIPVSFFDCVNVTVDHNFVDQGNFGTNSVGGFANTGYGIISYVTGPTLFTDGILCTNINFTFNTITNTAGSGLYVIGADTANIEGNNLSHVAMQQTNLSVQAGGINVSAVRSASVINNRIHWSSNNGAVFSSGMTNLIVKDNIITASHLNGIQIGSGESKMDGVNMTGNTIDGAAIGIYIVNATNAVIKQNVIYRTPFGLRTEAHAPASAYGTDRSDISENVFIDCPAGIQVLSGMTNRVENNFIHNSTNSLFTAVDFRGTNGFIWNNTIAGTSGTKVSDSGTGNILGSFDKNGLGIGTDSPFGLFHVYSPYILGGPGPVVILQTGGGAVGNGPAIDGYVKDPLGSPSILTRIQTSLQNNAAGAMSGDLRFQTTKLAVRNVNFTMGVDGLFDARLGYSVGGLAGSGQYVRGNGVYGVYAALNGSDMTVGTVAPARLGSGVMDATTYLAGDGTWKTYTAGLGGTVTSVALSAPSEFSVSGSPVTTSGTLTFSKANQVTNAIYIGPASGASAAPTFRGMVAADIPNAIIVATTKLTATGTKNATTVLYGDDTWKVPPGAVTNSGTVTSVAMTVPTGFTVSGSPITTSGTLAVTLANATSNTFLAGPASGAAATPGFRAFVADDIPNGQIIASAKLSATGTKDSTTFLRGDDTYAVPSGGSGTFFADPTGTIGLSPVNGFSTNAMRSDGHPALSQAIIPTWTGLHSFINGTTNQIKLGWDVTNVGYVWVDSSGNINFNPTSGEVNVAGVLDARDGFQIGDAAASGHYLRGNGTSYVDSSLNASDLATGTVPTAREGSGTANSTTFLSGDQTWKTAVTSIGLNAPAEFTVSGSPVTTSGTLAFAKASQAANTIYAAPDGASGVPTFRLQTIADLPSGTPFVVSIPNINSGTVGQTTLLTVPTGKRFMTLGIDIEPTTVSGGNNFQQDFFFSLGIGATVDNIWPNRTPSHEFIVGAVKPYGPPGDETQNDTIATAGQLVKLNIPAGGESQVGFEIVFTAHLRGYYR